MVDQRPGGLRRHARLLWLAWDVDLDENLLLRVRPGQRLGQVTRVDRVDELELPGSLLDLVGLEVADEMPRRAAHGGHLGQRLLDPVLAEDGQARVERLLALGRAKALRDGDDGDLVRVASGACDSVADRREVGCDGHRKATIAPNRVPSGWRRCEGNR